MKGNWARSNVVGSYIVWCFLCSDLALASEDVDHGIKDRSREEADWGIAATYRVASIPFSVADGDQSVSTFVPMMFFENEFVFVDGLEGGVYLYHDNEQQFDISAITRLRFVDIPASLQNANQGDAADFGFQWRMNLDPNWHADIEVMSDDQFRFHGNWRLGSEWQTGDWLLEPTMTLRYKDADFNSQYYAFSEFTHQRIGAGVDFNVGLDWRYHVYSNLYLLGSTSVTRLDSNAYNADIVDDRYQGEFSLGFGFFNAPHSAKSSISDSKVIANQPYLRLAHGWATPSNIGDIMRFNREKDPFNNQLSSLFYGHPLTDELFGLPLDIYLTPGIAHHWSSEVQSASTEWVLAVKAYYTFNWPTPWRVGVAEGVSYIDNITYVEGTEMEEKGYTPSHLLNYLDFSVDVNIGQLLNINDWRDVWLGYSLHHRSAIFESASQFGRIKGGSNYNTVYLQVDF